MARTRSLTPDTATTVVRRYNSEYPALFTVVAPTLDNTWDEFKAWLRDTQQHQLFLVELAAAERAGLVDKQLWPRIQNSIRQSRMKNAIYTKFIPDDAPACWPERGGIDERHSAAKLRLAWRSYVSRGTPAAFLGRQSRYAFEYYPKEYVAQLKKAMDNASPLELDRYLAKARKLNQL